MICLSSQNWSTVKKPVSQSVQWPERRYAHAASHITGPVFVMSGGYGDGSILSDVWLCNTNQWNKVCVLYKLSRIFLLQFASKINQFVLCSLATITT